MSTAKLTIVNTWPILVPAFLKSVVKLLNVAGNRPWIAAPPIPYAIVHTYIPARSETAIQQRQQMDVKQTAVMRVF